MFLYMSYISCLFILIDYKEASRDRMDDGQSLRTNEDHLSSDSEGTYGSRWSTTIFSFF